MHKAEPTVSKNESNVLVLLIEDQLMVVKAVIQMDQTFRGHYHIQTSHSITHVHSQSLISQDYLSRLN
jgi:hypothetical protein